MRCWRGEPRKSGKRERIGFSLKRRPQKKSSGANTCARGTCGGGHSRVSRRPRGARYLLCSRTEGRTSSTAAAPPVAQHAPSASLSPPFAACRPFPSSCPTAMKKVYRGDLQKGRFTPRRSFHPTQRHAHACEAVLNERAEVPRREKSSVCPP